jgi:hypothetical protein
MHSKSDGIGIEDRRSVKMGLRLRFRRQNLYLYLHRQSAARAESAEGTGSRSSGVGAQAVKAGIVPSAGSNDVGRSTGSPF